MQTRAPNLQAIRPIYLSLALFVLVALLTACGGGGVERSPDGVENSTDAGTENGPNHTVGAPPTGVLLESLPADYPETFQLYPGARVAETARFADQVVVTLETSDSRNAVAAFYREVVRQQPWEPLAEDESVGRGLLIIRFRHVDDPVRGQVSILTTSQDATEPIAVSLQFTVPKVVGETPASTTGQSQPTPTGDAG